MTPDWTATHPDADCFETREQTAAKLQAIETELALRFSIPAGVDAHERLIAMDRANELIEDEVVSRWFELLASWHDWEENP